jgi:hypothetical protein
VHSDGVNISMAGNVEDVNSSVQRLLFAQLTGFQDIMAEWKLLSYIVENIATALGMLETRVLGAGTAGDPRTLTIDASKVNEQTDVAFRFTGARKDGTSVSVDLFGVELDPTAFNISLLRGQQTTIPFRAKVTAGVLIRQG